LRLFPKKKLFWTPEYMFQKRQKRYQKSKLKKKVQNLSVQFFFYIGKMKNKSSGRVQKNKVYRIIKKHMNGISKTLFNA